METDAIDETSPLQGQHEEVATDQSPAARGGRAVVEKYGAAHMAAIGRKGSRAVVQRYGLKFYSEIASKNKGVKKRRRKDAERSE